MTHQTLSLEKYWKLFSATLIAISKKQNILFQYQFGFRKGQSTAQAKAELTDTLRKAIDNNLYTCGIFWQRPQKNPVEDYELIQYSTQIGNNGSSNVQRK